MFQLISIAIRLIFILNPLEAKSLCGNLLRTLNSNKKQEKEEKKSSFLFKKN